MKTRPMKTDESKPGQPAEAGQRLAAVIGAPVAHSLSPALHNAAFAATGIDAFYFGWHIEPSDLSAAVAGFRVMQNLLGVSVTVPHKQTVAALCDGVSSFATDIGAVNCLSFERTGIVGRPNNMLNDKMIGHNTDAGGFIDSLDRDAGVDPAGMRAVLLGAGGAARAVHVGLMEAGIDSAVVVARSPERAPWIEARPWTEGQLARELPSCDLLVDCTSAALSAEAEGQIPCAIPVRALPDHALVTSLVYHRQPALLRAAEARELATLDGAGMLVYQGARAFSLWTGVPAPVDAMWRAMRDALGQEATIDETLDETLDQGLD